MKDFSPKFCTAGRKFLDNNLEGRERQWGWGNWGNCPCPSATTQLYYDELRWIKMIKDNHHSTVHNVYSRKTSMQCIAEKKLTENQESSKSQSVAICW